MKPREFWIGKKDFDLGFEPAQVAEYPRNGTLGNSIHVIEKSAYLELLAEAMKLRRELSMFASLHFEAIHLPDRDQFAYPHQVAINALAAFDKFLADRGT